MTEGGIMSTVKIGWGSSSGSGHERTDDGRSTEGFWEYHLESHRYM